MAHAWHTAAENLRNTILCTRRAQCSAYSRACRYASCCCSLPEPLALPGAFASQGPAIHKKHATETESTLPAPRLRTNYYLIFACVHDPSYATCSPSPFSPFWNPQKKGCYMSFNHITSDFFGGIAFFACTRCEDQIVTLAS